MRFGNIESPDIIDTTCEVVYDSGELSSTSTSVTISNLTGDSDVEYRLICRFIGGNGDSTYTLRPNNDSSNSGYQRIRGESTAAAALRGTFAIRLGKSGATGYSSFSDTVIYAKSGKVRTGISKNAEEITGTTVTSIASYGWSWNNTVDEITSLVVVSDTANGIGIGSRFILLKKRQLTTGTKTGEIDPQGTTYGHWQLIYDNTLISAKTNLMLSSQMDSYTKLLIHADGADASTAFYDFSNSAHAITANGTAQVDTAQSKFGGASLLLDGNSDYLTVPDNEDWNFGSGDFTIDFWMRYNDNTNDAAILSQRVDDNNNWQVQVSSGGNYIYFRNRSSSSDTLYWYNSSAQSISNGVWTHIALVRSGSNFYIFLNGTSLAVTAAATGSATDFATTLEIGRNSTPDKYFNGWLDEIRISKGIARWTADFTPPTWAYNELDGDRDAVYKIVSRVINGYNGASAFNMRMNQDSSDTYGYQQLSGVGSSVAAERYATTMYRFIIGYATALSQLTMTETVFYVRSGFTRPAIYSDMIAVSGTTVTGRRIRGEAWNNVTDNIKSLYCYADYASGFGVGTHIELWRLNL